MASHLNDRLLWLCLGMSPGLTFFLAILCLQHVTDSTGVTLFFAVRGIATDLRRVRDLTEIKHVEKEDRMISEGTEDGWPIPCGFCLHAQLTLFQLLNWTHC